MSTSLWVPKTVSRSCFEGRVRIPCEPGEWGREGQVSGEAGKGRASQEERRRTLTRVEDVERVDDGNEGDSLVTLDPCLGGWWKERSRVSWGLLLLHLNLQLTSLILNDDHKLVSRHGVGLVDGL